MITVAACIFLLAAAGSLFVLPNVPVGARVMAILTTIGIVCGCALFTVRGYDVTPDGLYVRRLFWRTRIELAGLREARFDPEALKGSIRLWGNGGLFAFCGLFRNKKLGNFRLFATNLRQFVVLAGRERNVVVTPSNPEEFIRQVRLKAGLD